MCPTGTLFDVYLREKCAPKKKVSSGHFVLELFREQKETEQNKPLLGSSLTLVDCFKTKRKVVTAFNKKWKKDS